MYGRINLKYFPLDSSCGSIGRLQRSWRANRSVAVTSPNSSGWDKSTTCRLIWHQSWPQKRGNPRNRYVLTRRRIFAISYGSKNERRWEKRRNGTDFGWIWKTPLLRGWEKRWWLLIRRKQGLIRMLYACAYRNWAGGRWVLFKV